MLGALTSELREVKLACLEEEPVQRNDQTIVEQVLAQDVARLHGDDLALKKELLEARPLQLSDIIGIVMLHGSPKFAAVMLPHLPEVLQAEVIRTLWTQS